MHTVGWIVLILGGVMTLYGVGRLLFVVSTDFILEETTAAVGYDPNCVEANAADSKFLTACEQRFTGTVRFSNGTVQVFNTQAEYDAATAALRAWQRIKSIVILAAGVAASALGSAFLAASMSPSPRGRTTRRSTQRRRAKRPA
ncbi:MAG: hypothetical protein U0514_03040 [Candidatus Andersenbacteria bacterium]